MLLAYTGRMYEEMFKATEENQTACFNRYMEEKIPLDYWWTDAGWYKCKKAWSNTGTWEVDRKRFPRGLKAITDLAHARGMKTPALVRAGTGYPRIRGSIENTLNGF